MNRKNLYKVVTFMSILLLVISAVMAKPFISVVIDGKKVNFTDAHPYMDENSRILIPVRVVSEELGAKVIWNSSSKKVTIIKGKNTAELTIGEKQVKVNDEIKQLDTKPCFKNTKIFVPLRFVSEALDAKVTWNGDTRCINISSQGTLGALEHTDIFVDSALNHIFSGQINVNGEASGYHYEGMPGAKGRVVQGTESAPNELGVYTAKVEVDGVLKAGNSGYSTFYPKNWTMQQVVDAINEAYKNKIFKSGNEYYGYDSRGMKISMYIDDKTDKIISAFPVLY